MRGKRAKALRRLANKVTVGMSARGYEDRALNKEKPFRRTRFLDNCTRLVYRNLKKHYTGRPVPYDQN